MIGQGWQAESSRKERKNSAAEADGRHTAVQRRSRVSLRDHCRGTSSNQKTNCAICLCARDYNSGTPPCSVHMLVSSCSWVDVDKGRLSERTEPRRPAKITVTGLSSRGLVGRLASNHFDWGYIVLSRGVCKSCGVFSQVRMYLRVSTRKNMWGPCRAFGVLCSLEVDTVAPRLL